MATTKPQVKTKAPVASPAAAPASKPKKAVSDLPFLFDRTNYMIMGAGVAVIIVGFLLMTGAANDNPAVFNADEIYSFRRITLAPVVVMIGFLIEVYAILKRPAATTA
ncbi:MAG: DUF3098 domain-containing protein [Bacteroidetes bacterium]|nr:DUF3098 domain-containing protein [Bacteroidota bacterium]